MLSSPRSLAILIVVVAVFVVSILGGAGNDTINMGANLTALDTIDGGGDADTITGGSGNDIITGGAGNDIITVDAGTDLSLIHI